MIRVRVVLRHHHDVAGIDARFHILASAVAQDHVEAAFDHVVEADHVRRRWHEKAAVLGIDPARDEPGLGEFGVHVNAAGEPDDPQHI